MLHIDTSHPINVLYFMKLQVMAYQKDVSVLTVDPLLLCFCYCIIPEVCQSYWLEQNLRRWELCTKCETPKLLSIAREIDITRTFSDTSGTVERESARTLYRGNYPLTIITLRHFKDHADKERTCMYMYIQTCTCIHTHNVTYTQTYILSNYFMVTYFIV